jgi:hypothetical protein
VSPLRVEFHLPAEPTERPADAWRDGRVSVEAGAPELATGLERAFRRTPVVVDDASLLPAGTRGSSMLPPGDLEWFRGVAMVRVPQELGLVPRFVPGPQMGGYDPAANYRPFREQVERLDARSGA